MEDGVIRELRGVRQRLDLLVVVKELEELNGQAFALVLRNLMGEQHAQSIVDYLAKAPAMVWRLLFLLSPSTACPHP